MTVDQYNQSIWDSFPHLRQEKPQMSTFTSRFFRRKPRGHSARHESTEPGSAEYAAGLERITECVTAWNLALAIAQTDKEKVLYAEQCAKEILKVCRAVEERLSSSKGTHGEAAEDAQVQKVIHLTGGLQLVFDLYCTSCHFQCWSCPACSRVRCGCAHSACGCEVD
jgi:hypothetical protein